MLALERMAKRWEVRGGTPCEKWEADSRQDLEVLLHSIDGIV